MTRLFQLISAALMTALFCGPMRAADFPDYREIYVNDFAGLLAPQQADELREKLKTLRDVHGIEFTVVTISRMADHGHTGAIEPFATGLFNHWGLGDAQRNDGVMLLVARQDRKMRIEVGSGYGNTKNTPMQRIIDNEILPEFRNDRYAAGILNGADAVIRDLTSGGSAVEGSDPKILRGWARIWHRFEQFALDNSMMILASISAAGLSLVAAGRLWFRNRPRHCPVDGSRMIRLSEAMDDAYLDSGQRVEERLKSKDYDVWDCPDCNHVTVEGYKGWFSRMGACRSCGYRTLQGDTTVLTHATTSSTGLKRIDYHCHHCSDSFSATRIIPKKSKSSSSSSSFGGGSSSGGGASGSW